MRLIDADALYDKAETWYKNAPTPYQKIYRSFVAAVADAPTVNAAPVVHGRWIGEEINIETGDISDTFQECNMCHRIRPVDSYCSHCGAKMYLPEDGE